jgi:hypothetical protein
MVNETGPAPHPLESSASMLEEMRGRIGPIVERAFLAQFGKTIEFYVEARDTEGGGRVAIFKFRMSRPGLLPTAIERQWFDGFVSGFKAFYNHAAMLLEVVGKPPAAELDVTAH